jgi:hypothetical protein
MKNSKIGSTTDLIFHSNIEYSFNLNIENDFKLIFNGVREGITKVFKRKL